MSRGQGQIRTYPGGRGASRQRWLQDWPQCVLPQLLASWIFPTFEPASPYWCCELPDSLLLLFKIIYKRLQSFSGTSPDLWSLLWAVSLWSFLHVPCGAVVFPLEGLKNTDAWALPWRFWSSKLWGSFGLDGSSSWKSHSLGPASSSVQGTKRQCLRKWAWGRSITRLNCLSQNPSQLVNLTYENSLRHRESHYSIGVI